MQYIKHLWEHMQHLHVLGNDKRNDKITEAKGRKQCWKVQALWMPSDWMFS